MRTFCTIVRDTACVPKLDAMAAALARARHWCFREIHIRGRLVKDVKRDAIARFAITARHFNGVRFELDQAVAAWKASLRYRMSKAEDRVDAISKRIVRLDAQISAAKSDASRARLKLARHGKLRHLARTRDTIARLRQQLADKPRICFGGRRSLRAGDLAAWADARSGTIMLVGSKDESAGNQSAQWDGSSLRLRLPDAMGGGRIRIADVSFRFGQEPMEAALARGDAIAWRLSREDGVWRLFATIDEAAAAVVTDRRAGVIGIDLNIDHLAVVGVDRMGNPSSRATLPFPDRLAARGAGHRAAATIGDAVRDLVAMAIASGRPLAIEALDFAKEKAALKEVGPSHARRMSGIAYARFAQMLKARCHREGVEVIEVDHAYTTVIGRLKYAKGHAMSRHHAAALVIGRRALGMGERFVCMGVGALAGPGRNRPRHAASRWRGAKLRLTPTARGPGIGRRRGHARVGRPGEIPADPPSGRSRSGGVGTGAGPSQVGDAVVPAAIPRRKP